LLGVAPKPETARQILSRQLAEQSGLDSETVERLSLFDAFEFSEEPFGFRDLVAARQYARLIEDGLDWLGLARAIQSGRVAAPGGSLASVRLELMGGDVMIRAGQALTDLSGQHLLDFPIEESDRADQLFEGAQEAEEIGDWERARILYEKCLAIEPRDPVIAFNLSHAFMQLGNASEARRYLHKVLSLDKNYAEAWYNLGSLARERKDMSAARRHLQKAIAADPTYPDPLFNLALVEFEAGAHDEASRLWQRYRELDPGSEWSEKAKHGLQLIQLMAQHPGLKVERPEAPGPLRAAR
jgi:tetratricopeptide (TPR) repeat protein